MNLVEIPKLLANAQPSGGDLLMPISSFLLIIVIMYFLMIRPQKKKEKLKNEMLSQLIVGDRILTIGGIHGKIVEIKGENLIIETGKANEASTLKITRWAISEVTKPGDEPKASGNSNESSDDEE
ncbi:MAG: preprotein translocase subunit YajC [Clostridia bacterium]|nr:preprotein translocase subunit YajC [Clostridia bacterium]